MSRQVPRFRRTAIALLTSALALPFAAQALQVCPVEPCRVLDTRLATDSNVDHPLAPDETTTIFVANSGPATLSGQGGEVNCDVPFPQAKGVFVNVVAVQPTGSFNNHMTLYPAESVEPTASTINYEPGTFALANGVFVKTCDAATATGGCLGGDLTITNGPSATTDVVIDVTGYIAATCPVIMGP
jgi:hypothetical protein